MKRKYTDFENVRDDNKLPHHSFVCELLQRRYSTLPRAHEQRSPMAVDYEYTRPVALGPE